MTQRRMPRLRKTLAAGVATLALLAGGGVAGAAIAPPPGLTPMASGCGESYTLRGDGLATASWYNCSSTSTRVKPRWQNANGYFWGACQTVTPYGTAWWRTYWASVAYWSSC